MKETKPNPLLQKIFELRKAKKITLDELGKVMGVKKATAGHIENGLTPLKGEYIPAIAKLLGVKIWELFEGYEDSDVVPLSEEETELILAYRKVKKKKTK